MSGMKHRVLVVPPISGLFGASGSARSSEWQALTLANELAQDSGLKVIVALSAPLSNFFELDRAIDVRMVAASDGWRAFMAAGQQRSVLHTVARIVLGLRIYVALLIIRLRDRPDAAVAFVTATNLIAVLALRASSVVVSERSDFERKDSPRLLKWLAVMLYRRARSVTSNHPVTVASFRERLPNVSSVFVSNFADLQELEAPRKKMPAPARLVMVGRLSPEKNHAFVIDCMQTLQMEFPGLTLDILGDGKGRLSLEAQIAAAGLQEVVCLHGHVGDVRPFVSRSDLLFLASDYEGLPNVCLEAMALGTPCVVSTSVSSMDNLFSPEIEFYQYDHLSASSFETTVRRALSNQAHWEHVSLQAASAVHRVCDRENVMVAWRTALKLRGLRAPL